MACISKGPVSLQDVLDLDTNDALASLRTRFEIEDGLVYLDGNSLGALPAATPARLFEVRMGSNAPADSAPGLCCYKLCKQASQAATSHALRTAALSVKSERGCKSPTLMRQVLRGEWGIDLISSWNKHGWISLPLRVGAKLGKIIGAHSDEVVAADSTSVNLFKAVSAALQLRPDRTLIVSGAPPVT